MKTLEHLKDYFSTTDNTYVQNKLKILELEIDHEIIKAKMDGVNSLAEKLLNDEK